MDTMNSRMWMLQETYCPKCHSSLEQAFWEAVHRSDRTDPDVVPIGIRETPEFRTSCPGCQTDLVLFPEIELVSNG